ncbi:hypothetical protein PSE10B_55920 [Pseudomonas amygdali pv. eriobotryae]|uniref:hypothetical protein n=1 Tax=Pseudomonas amygdali TaxID=47877 RepID=UPI0016787FE9|nr:hypothetical protein [Pseudomonas amygdali]GFZ69070.1 hypothetical protein PSE10B_55920 [Pseudomonas amygdali pv. eriobotryae]
MSQLDELDKSMATIGEIADLLEAQIGSCERGRMPLVTWITNRFHSPEELEKAARDLPQLPSAMRMDYAAWIHSFKHA